jgi:hypothetical protein
MGMTLGRFGDRRLEKGGPISLASWYLREGASCAFGGWARTEPGRCN